MSNNNPSIIIGRPQTLDCSVTGSPRPTITWMKVSPAKTRKKIYIYCLGG